MTEGNVNPVNSACVLETARIDVGGGWSGRAVLSGPDGERFTRKDWEECLSGPEGLLDGAERTIKRDGRTVVLVRELKVGGERIMAAIKSESVRGGFKGFWRSLLRGKGLRNFDTAVRLCRNNIPVVEPLAALELKKGPFVVRSIYITRYIEGSTDLQRFLRENMELFNNGGLSFKKDICGQAAGILSALENASLWHRDAKAGNFLVCPAVMDNKDGSGYRLVLVDMDGIKRNLFGREELKLRSVSKLAATVMWHPYLSRTDGLRTFKMYSSLSGLKESRRGEILRTVAVKAMAIRLLTMSNTAIGSRRLKREKS